MPLFEEELTVRAPAEAVWDFLLDPKRLGACLPGCESLEVEDESTYRLRVTVKVGFLSTTQHIRVTVTEAERPSRLVSVGRGEDRRLGSNIEMRTVLDLERADTNVTRLRFQSELHVLGRLGSIGDAVMKAKAKELTREFTTKLRSAIEAGA